MARIRTIKPDAFASDSLSQVPIRARWTFAGLWTFADDDGRARADARLIKAYIYPLDDDVTARDVEADLEALERVGCICRYEAAGKRYLCMPGWLDHQKISHPAKSKIPPPPESSGNPPEPSGSLSGPGDGPNQGAGEPRNGSDDTGTASSSALGQQQQIAVAEPAQTVIVAGQPASPESSVNPPETLQSPPEVLRPEVEREVEREREEERGEESAHNAPPPRSDIPKRGTRLPVDWCPTGDDLKITGDEGLTHAEAVRELAKFRDYWTAVPGAKGVKKDWPATWRNWIRRAADDRRPGASRRSSFDPNAGIYRHDPNNPETEFTATVLSIDEWMKEGA